MDTGVSGCASELVASLLAEHLGILRPLPAVIEIDADLARVLEQTRSPQEAKRIKGSGGLNFGSKFLIDVSTWSVGRPLPDALRRAAAEVFAFDALIQNDDRRYNNPNLFARGDEILIFDHELAFSFLFLLGAQDVPWQLMRRRSLDDHVFYLQLKGKAVNLEKFIAALAGFGESEMEEVIEAIPREWRTENMAKISAHIVSVRNHVTDFALEVKKRLA